MAASIAKPSGIVMNLRSGRSFWYISRIIIPSNPRVTPPMNEIIDK